MARFTHSRKLIDIIEATSWQLYDVTMPDGRQLPWGFPELEQKGTARSMETGGQYLFAPKPSQGQTLRDAYSVTKGLGPAIVLPSIPDHADMDGEGGRLLNDKLYYIFTRLIFGGPTGNMLLATSPAVVHMPQPPFLVIPYRSVVEKFSNFFRIVTPQEMQVDAEELRNMPRVLYHNKGGN
ncbi:hypothetical protein HY642_00585 [Candidatus Woesearchaeota archaeon]|nr:hypothetical protein [Candidatus Woesearchaeota archaeon]